ncbi:MAG: hypothetical protein LBT51_01130 [Fusobacteriaceae bacterium]|jgi:hypothetical protein|nr:hypothetical protein [Fusobacteriaceae bacterium]
MIFGLPALLGFLPLAIYLYLAFKGKNLLSTVMICVVIGAILTKQTPVTFAGEIAKGVASFLGLIGFIIISTLVGIFGVSGAAVAQSVVINDLFKSIVTDINLPMIIWGTVLLIGSQITSFAYPTGDMIGQMGIARSKDIKSMIRNGVSITVVMVAYMIIRALFYVLTK